MWTIFKQEMRQQRKSFFIWLLCVGGFGLFCVLLFTSVKDSMAGMAESFASMGAFAEAFGMSQLSIATLEGFYATEVGTVHALGGAMFAAILGTTMLSKEEDGHTGEFLFSLPVARGKVVLAKWGAVASNVILLNAGCVLAYFVGIQVLGEEIDLKRFFLYHGMQLVMQLEIGAICFAISAFLKRNKMGVGIGIVLLLYLYDLMARIVPDLEKTKYLSPFSYANAADIFSTGKMEAGATVLGVVVLVAGLGTALTVYGKRDLAT